MTNPLKSANIVLFDLLGVILKVDNPLDIVNRTLIECRQKVEPELVDKQFNLFIKGKLSEDEFWQSLGLNDYSMIRKLVLERLEYSLDNDFVKVLPSFTGKKIGVKGNIPMEWVEQIFDSSGLSSMIHMYLFSYDLGKLVEEDEIYDILSERFPNGSLFMVESNVKKYDKDVQKGLNSSLFLRKASPVDKMPQIIFTNMEDVERLLF